jgi:hypothetical protein
VNRRLTSVLLVATLAGAVLAGCAPAPEVSASASEQLQTSVRLVATHAAANDTASAVTELDALQAQLDAAVASDDVSDERAQTVQAKIDLVRADLAQRIADAEAAAAAAVEAKRIEDEKAAVEAQRVIDEQAEAQRLADEKAARDDDKPGNGNGNGPKNKDEEEDEE